MLQEALSKLEEEKRAFTGGQKERPARETYAAILDPWLAWVEAGSRRDKDGGPVQPDPEVKQRGGAA